MKNILNYKLTKHFEERLSQRQIDPFLISMCLVKGDKKSKEKYKVEYTLSKESIIQAIEQGYLLTKDCICITSLTVVTRANILITVFVRCGDTGISEH